MTTSSTAHTVGSAVRAARQRDGLGSRHLAHLCGLSSGYVSRIENDQAAPTAEKCFAIADALARPRISLGYLSGTVNAEFFLEETARARRLLDDWNPDQDAIAMEHLDREHIASIAERLFVELSLPDALEAIGFGGFDVPVIVATGLTSQRLEVVEAFTEEQRVLSDLDRRGANTARWRLRGGLIDEDDNARFHKLVEKGLNAEPAANADGAKKERKSRTDASATRTPDSPAVSEVWAGHAFSESPTAIGEVFHQLPQIMRDAVLHAAERPDTWISYEELDNALGKPRNTFARSFGGYRSKDPTRPRPLHLGTDTTGRFYLLVDAAQAAAITGTSKR